MEDIERSPQTEDMNPQVSTLVFMDLEATGLPSFVGKNNVHITEISLIAINRHDFENDESLRVLNKLSLCIRPRARVSPGAMSITGLYNDVLENQEVFDDTIPKLLKYFFRRLRSPVCLVAHNGNKYDFPLLQAELKRIDYTLGPNVLCVDSLEALRSILSTSNVCVQKSIPVNVVEHNAASKTVEEKRDSLSSDEEIDNLLSKDMELFQNVDMNKHFCENELEISFSNTDLGVNSKNKEAEERETIAFKNEHTPTSKSTIQNEVRQKRKKKLNPDPTFSPKKQYKCNGYVNSDVRRKLFVEVPKSSNNDAIVPRIFSFSLPKLYYHFFGEDPPVSHYAEADCSALSKVCQKVSKEFLQWMDDNCFPFDNIKEMW